MTFDRLAFVRVTLEDDRQKVAAWEPVRTDDYVADNKTGRAYFNELQALMRSTGNPAYLSRVLAAQVKGGVWEAVEIGFAQAMAESVMA